MDNETERYFSTRAFLDNCFYPTVSKLRLATGTEDRLCAQIALVEVCWWLNLALACKYIAEEDVHKLLSHKEELFSLNSIEDLIKQNGQQTLPQDLLKPLKLEDATPSTLKDIVWWKNHVVFRSPNLIKSHFQALLILAGKYETQNPAQFLLSRAAFANDEDWNSCVRGTPSPRRISRMLTSPIEELVLSIELLITGFFQIMDHIAILMDFFESISISDIESDMSVLETRVKNIFRGRINFSNKQFKKRIFEIGNWASELLQNQYQSEKTGREEYDNFQNKFQYRVRHLISSMEPASHWTHQGTPVPEPAH